MRERALLDPEAEEAVVYPITRCDVCHLLGSSLVAFAFATLHGKQLLAPLLICGSGTCSFTGKPNTAYLLWMDEFLHRFLRNPGMMIPLQIPIKNGFPWIQSGAGFCPSTVLPHHIHLAPHANRFMLGIYEIHIWGPIGTHVQAQRAFPELIGHSQMGFETHTNVALVSNQTCLTFRL